jgi:hypothetical protein
MRDEGAVITKAEAHQRLVQLGEEHEADRDGGYAFVESILRALAELAPEDRMEFAEALADLVRARAPAVLGRSLGSPGAVGRS